MTGQRSGGDSLADAGVGAGDEEAAADAAQQPALGEESDSGGGSYSSRSQEQVGYGW